MTWNKGKGLRPKNFTYATFQKKRDSCVRNLETKKVKQYFLNHQHEKFITPRKIDIKGSGLVSAKPKLHLVYYSTFILALKNLTQVFFIQIWMPYRYRKSTQAGQISK